MKNLKLRDLTEIAVFAALIAVIAPFSVFIGPIPLSLATFIIYVAAGTLGKTRGTIAVLIYILLGAAGVPVFSGWGAGIPKIIGPTGGFIVGYLPLAYISGVFADSVRFTKSGCASDTKKPENAKKSPRNILAVWQYPAGMLVGTAVLYALGTVWFMYQSGRTLIEALTLCVLPFIIGDAIKIIVSAAIAPVLRLSVNKIKARSR